jgi:Arrestin (or S-antigen), N-terminal domain
VKVVLNQPVWTQYVQLKFTGLIVVSMGRKQREEVIFEEELRLWGTRGYIGTEGLNPPEKRWEVTSLMEEGEHPFPFEFKLPEALPPTLDVCFMSAFQVNLVQARTRHVHNRMHSSAASNTSSVTNASEG